MSSAQTQTISDLEGAWAEVGAAADSVNRQFAVSARDCQNKTVPFFRDLNSCAAAKAEAPKPFARHANVRNNLLISPIGSVHTEERRNGQFALLAVATSPTPALICGHDEVSLSRSRVSHLPDHVLAPPQCVVCLL
jgi:hypothetical protein